MLSNRRKIVTIGGPTCTGKSELSIRLAREFGGEIVNADSMQVYKYFDIGTAKPDHGLRAAIAHHLVDVVEPFEQFNAALFKDMADRAIRDIWSRGKVPIVVGGTGLYMRALVYDLFKVPKSPEIRDSLKKAYAENPMGLYEALKEVDSEYALKISHRDKVRVVRAMEVFRLTGTRMSEWRKMHGFQEARYSVLKIGLGRTRQELYRRINQRVEEMLKKGWVEEVRQLLSVGCKQDIKPFSSIGYKEILIFLRGLISYEDMVQNIKKSTRHYAKRQFTWFLKEKDMRWYEFPEQEEAIRQTIEEFLAEWN